MILSHCFYEKVYNHLYNDVLVNMYETLLIPSWANLFVKASKSQNEKRILNRIE